MNYKEYAEMMRNVKVSDKLEYKRAMLWLDRWMLPIGLLSLGGEDSEIIKVPRKAKNDLGNTVSVIYIEKSAFAGNERITDIVLLPSIGSLPKGAFAGCKSLKNITIPKNITIIKEGTFKDCDALENIYYEGTAEEWKKIKIVREKHEIEFGELIPGSPVESVTAERIIHIPGNDAVFSANIHCRCDLTQTEAH